MKQEVVFHSQPLKHLQLRGLHLIEASAGTGKTWTLSGLMLRILVEKYMPRQVIATTFTRAAAAELKTRIRKRLSSMYQRSLEWQQLPTHALSAYAETLDDPLEYLIFTQFAPSPQHNFFYLHDRLKLVIDSLDELFVGTIDSFTQKLLREFSFESGEVMPRQLSENEQYYPYQIVHDVLRGWLQTQPQQVVDILLLAKQLKSTEHYIATVQKTLNFGQAKLHAVSCPQLAYPPVQHSMQQLKELVQQGALQQLHPYYLKEGAYYVYINKKAFAKDKFYQIFANILPKFVENIPSGQEFNYFLHAFKEDLKQINSLFEDSKGNPRDTIFKSCAEHIVHDFYQHPLIIALQDFYQCTTLLKRQLKQLDEYLHYYLSIETRKKMPQVLLQAGETTFNQQIRNLSAALHGDKGQGLAAVIQQRYPIILVDEFQDTNQEQDDMLKAIWRYPQRLQQGCFIAVGDPKQAIYGFRGGDILTYLNAFTDIAHKQGRFYRLSENFRSVPSLVAVVDALFQRQTDFAEQIRYFPALSGTTQLAPLLEDGQANVAPLRLVALTKEQQANEAFLVAGKIRDLLAKAQQGRLYLGDAAQHTRIQPEDIAVLAVSNRELDQVQKQLAQLQINVNRSALSSVFSSPAAQDVAAVLQAIQFPERESILKRALLIPAIGLTLTDFSQFDHDAELLNVHVQHFRQARQIWLQKGFLLAWDYLAEQYQFWLNLATHTGLHAERMIVNTKHLLELLTQHSQYYQGIQHLLQWYLLQLGAPMQRDWELERKLSSESGVQLMTIHKSKGLEFKIVFLLHANKAINEQKQSLAFYAETTADAAAPQRVIATSAALLQQNTAAQQANREKIAGENHRLWYVALTRASYRIYAMLYADEKTPSLGAMGYWLNAQADAFEHEFLAIEDAAHGNFAYQPQLATVPSLTAQDYPAVQFYPQTRTSFSGIAAHLKTRQSVDGLAAMPDSEDAAQDEVELSNVMPWSGPSNSQTLDWIQRHFPRGTQAGNCLHEILENLDFHQLTSWGALFKQKLSQYGLWGQLRRDYQQDYATHHMSEQAIQSEIVQLLYGWFKQILQSPLLANGLRLQDIATEHRLAEFSFFMSLADQRFDSQRIHDVLNSYAIDIPQVEPAYSARVLTGAIDLVFFDGQRYHIADYKSNKLGDKLFDYAETALAQNMSHASYWLQACIYLVALHRYLQSNLAGYQPELHLGGACYLYLRGMQGHVGYGVKYWQPDLSLLLALDSIFGQHQQPSSL